MENKEKEMVHRYEEEIGERWRVKRWKRGGEKVRGEKDVQLVERNIQDSRADEQRGNRKLTLRSR